jgi:hypothetical protein
MRSCLPIISYELVLMQQSRPTPPSNTRLSPLPPEPADFYNDFSSPVDIPMDTSKVVTLLHCGLNPSMYELSE